MRGGYENKGDAVEEACHKVTRSFPCILWVFLGTIENMATKKKANGKKKHVGEKVQSPVSGIKSAKWHSDLKPETKKSVFAVFLFLVTALLALSYVGQGGAAGALVFRAFDFLLGKGYFFAPLILVLMGFSLLFSGPKRGWRTEYCSTREIACRP